MIGYAEGTSSCYAAATSPCYGQTYDDPCLYVIYEEHQNFFWSLHVAKLIVDPSSDVPFAFHSKTNIGVGLRITNYFSGNFGTGQIRGIACDSDNVLIFYGDSANFPLDDNFPSVGHYDKNMALVRRMGFVATPPIKMDTGVNCAMPDNIGGTAGTPYMQFHKFFPGTGLPDSYYPEIYNVDVLNATAVGDGGGFDLIAPSYDVVANPPILGTNRSHGALLGDGSVIYSTRAGLRAMIPNTAINSGTPVFQSARPEYPARAAIAGSGLRWYSFAVTTVTQSGYGDSSIEIRDTQNNVVSSVDGDAVVRQLLGVTPGFYRVLFMGGI